MNSDLPAGRRPILGQEVDMRTYDDLTGIEGKPRAAVHEPRDASQTGLAGLPGLVASRSAEPSAVLDLQRAAGNEAVAQLLTEEDRGEQQRSPVLDVVGRGGGQPLQATTRSVMEGALGADFSGVRVHTDGAAAASAQAVQAHAYTVGNDVVFQQGLYQPETPGGQRMLAHELTHVVQQRSGPVDGTATGSGISVSHPSDSFERAAEASADRFMAGGGVEAHSSPAGPSPAASNVQREAADEQPAVQRAFVQRAEEEEEPVQGAFVQRAEEEEEPVQGAFVQRADEEEEKEAPAAG
jgi:hypothetical protein